MTPTGQNNIAMMEAILEMDERDFTISRQYGITSSKEALAYAIESAFGGAEEGDVSLLYISTHGAFDASYNNPEGTLLLSDGQLEDRVTARQLNEMLDGIAGTKVLLIDACNSGALIGKGISPDEGSSRVARMFQEEDYRVLTSSGASEPSWYWVQSMESVPLANSYFTTALALGAGYLGEYAADLNKDGTITMAEMYHHLWVNHASSAVQMTPQDDDFALFEYDKGRLMEETQGVLGGFVFHSTALDAANPVLTFSYTAKKAARVVYSITYYRDGKWDWQNTVDRPDTQEYDGNAEPLGDITPGRKQVTLDLSEILPEGWTYAMIHVMTTQVNGEDAHPFIYASRVLQRRQGANDPGLSVGMSSTWNRSHKQELEVFVGHAIPCVLSVTVYDAEGTLVKRLSPSRLTRPESLTPDGSLFYWNGLNKVGEPVEAGKYRIEALSRGGGNAYPVEAWVTVE